MKATETVAGIKFKILTIWNFDRSYVPLACLLTFIAGLATWLCFRFISRKSKGNSWRFGEIFQYAVFPVFFIGFANLAAAKINRGVWNEALANMIAAVLVLAAAFSAFRLQVLLIQPKSNDSSSRFNKR